MTYRQVVKRSVLFGDYVDPMYIYDSTEQMRQRIAGDLRRLEADQRDQYHLQVYAHAAGITPEQAKAVLDAFFDDTVFDRAIVTMAEGGHVGTA